MEHGYISTLKIFGGDGHPVHAVVDHQDDQDIAERRCENLAAFGREHALSFQILLCHEGEVLKEWNHG